MGFVTFLTFWLDLHAKKSEKSDDPILRPCIENGWMDEQTQIHRAHPLARGSKKDNLWYSNTSRKQNCCIVCSKFFKFRKICCFVTRGKWKTFCANISDFNSLACVVYCVWPACWSWARFSLELVKKWDESINIPKWDRDVAIFGRHLNWHLSNSKFNTTFKVWWCNGSVTSWCNLRS